MESPRATGDGATRAWISLGSGTTKAIVVSTGPRFKDRKLYAAAIDRYADIFLSEGRHSAAERLIDGTVVLFDRKYRPRWCRYPDGTITTADPSEWIDNIVQELWFYSERASLPARKQINPRIAAEWRLK